MDTLQICMQCRKPLPENTQDGLCPECRSRFPPGGMPTMRRERIPPEPGELAAQFPRLEILELVGVGGMGMVYKARQPRLDRLVALKILPIDSMPDPSLAERFEREARALAKLSHPGIVTLHDFGQTDAYCYFIMEFVDGTNLRKLIQAKSLAPRQTLEMIRQICEALQYAHDENVVHRDIKPENILVGKKGQVKIADFGLAKLLGSRQDTSLTASQLVMGTVNYMAPEQRESSRDVDHRADIYSLGVVFYEMLTGEVPMGRFDAPSKKAPIDARLDEVVLHALEREPSRRYQSVSEIRSGVESIASSAAVPPLIGAPSVRAPAEASWSRVHYSDVLTVVWFLVLGVLAYLSGKFMPSLRILLFAIIIPAAVIRLSSRVQIQRARESGLWPQPGELATIEHVRRLALAREKKLATKLYRQIHGGSRGNARSAIKKLASP